MAVYIGHDECQVIYVAKNGVQLRVSSVWVGDQQVFPPANRQEVHVFTRDTQGYGRTDKGSYFDFTVPVPWWATAVDVVLIGAGEKGRDGTKSFSGGSDGAGGRSGAWVVKTVALPQSPDAIVFVGKGTSTSTAATSVYLPGVGGQSDVLVHDGEGTRTPNSGSTGGSVTPQSRTEFGSLHGGGYGGSRNNTGVHPGGGGGGGQGSNLLGNPQAGRNGGDGYVWLRFRSAPALNPGDEEFILRVGVTSGVAYVPLRAWAVGIGKTHQTITEITVPMEVVGQSLESLFYDCHALASVPAMDTSQVTDMRFMFYGCHALASVPAMDTSQVTDMYAMFFDCYVLTTIPAMDTSKVTNMYAMFSGCRALTSIPALNTSQVTNTGFMFNGCSSLTSIPTLDTIQVTDMRFMFYNCSSLASVPAMDTSQVTGMYGMFSGCSSLTTIPALDTTQVTNMQSMFNGCSSLTSIPAMDTSQVTDMQWMFNGCSSLTSIPAMDTSKVTDMSTMFYGCSSLTSIPALNTSQVTDMGYIFRGCSSLTSIPAMDTSQVTDTSAMFYNCTSLESVTLPGLGSAFTDKQTLDMRTTVLNDSAANALMQSFGTPPPGGTLQLPSTARGADRSIATAKNWTVTIG